MRNLWTFLRLPLAEKAVVLEALTLLALARLAVLVLPFRWVARGLGKPAAETPAQDDAANAPVAYRISWVVHRAAKGVPWTSKCLDQALAARIMLARRGIATTVYFGVQHDEQGQLAAHAWLRCGRFYVTGGALRNRYTVINTFGDVGIS